MGETCVFMISPRRKSCWCLRYMRAVRRGGERLCALRRDDIPICRYVGKGIRLAARPADGEKANDLVGAKAEIDAGIVRREDAAGRGTNAQPFEQAWFGHGAAAASRPP